MPLRLFCFPFAGGSSYSYRGLAWGCDSIKVTGLELPGHGRRRREKLLTDIDLMVEDLYRQMRSLLDVPSALFGHSMGADLAHLLARRMAREGHPPPRFLFVSGRKAPVVFKRETRHLMPRREFLKALEELEGCPLEALADPELMELLEPVLRADFSAIASYRYEEATPIEVPIMVMTGVDDDVTDEDALEWRRETSCECRHVRFPGGHFFIDQNWSEIRQLMAECLASVHAYEGPSRWMMSR
jgi:surfactin synthase thioesterase subunit